MHYQYDKINIFIVNKIYLLYAQNCTKESCQDFKSPLACKSVCMCVLVQFLPCRVSHY